MILVSSLNSWGQTYRVEGLVIDQDTEEPVPFANVLFQHTTKGTLTDTSGHFELTSKEPHDSLLISVLGYETQVIQAQSGSQLKVALKSTLYDLSEIVILPGENPAWGILRKAIARKPQNNPEGGFNLQYESYDKVQFDLNHFTEKIKRNILLRPFDFIWDHVDSTDDGVAYLPILLIETLSDHYFDSVQQRSSQVLKASQTTGLEGPKIKEFVQDMHIDPNIYEDYVVILEKSFPSPLNDQYKRNYRFYLTDSLIEDGETYYQIVFKPRNINDLAFNGEMLLHKPTYAVKELTLRFDIHANVNFVRSYWLKQQFDQIEGRWVMTSSNIIGDFTVLENQAEMTGFFGRKSSTRKDIKVDQVIPNSVFKSADPQIVLDSTFNRTDQYWSKNRHETLSDQESEIYTMVDRIEKDPAFILRKNIANAIWNGYYPIGPIDMGNIFTFYSYNQVEYSRFKLGFRTNDRFSKKWWLSTFGAYGTRDELFKYGLHLRYTFNQKINQRNRIGALTRFDIEQLGWSYNFLPIDHAIASLIQVNLSQTRMYNRRHQLYLERQWTTGLTTRITAFHHEVAPNRAFEFTLANDMGSVSSFKEGGYRVSIRYAKGDRDLSADYQFPSHRLKFKGLPVVSLEFTQSIQGTFESQFDYQRLKVRLDHRVRMRKFGYTNYLAEAGKVFGSVPYPFLEVPLANEIIFYDKIAYNLMGYLEFISDEFIQFQLEHHFEGLIMNRIPLIKKLKLRTLAFGKVYAGRLTGQNQPTTYLFPEGSGVMTTPYAETGFGIENILKISRIDFVWRMNYLGGADVIPFIVKPSFQFNF